MAEVSLSPKLFQSKTASFKATFLSTVTATTSVTMIIPASMRSNLSCIRSVYKIITPKNFLSVIIDVDQVSGYNYSLHSELEVDGYNK